MAEGLVGLAWVRGKGRGEVGGESVAGWREEWHTYALHVARVLVRQTLAEAASRRHVACPLAGRCGKGGALCRPRALRYIGLSCHPSYGRGAWASVSAAQSVSERAIMAAWGARPADARKWARR